LAPRKDVNREIGDAKGVVITRRVILLPVELNVHCAAAIFNWSTDNLRKDCFVAIKSNQTIKINLAPRKDVNREIDDAKGVVIARRMKKFEWYKSLCCAVAIFNWSTDNLRNRLLRRHKK
jgi:hypothetical protein